MMSNADFNVSAEYEAEVIPGIEDVSVSELRSVCGARVSDIRRLRAGFLRFQFRGDPSLLGGLRSVIAIYHAHYFAIPRPKALLGHQHFTRLIAILRATSAPWILSHHTFGIGAAGSDSSVMRRLRRETGRALQMAPAPDGKGELYFRLQRSRDKRGWELLVRLTPQPLSKRAYRVVDLPGALNAAAAYAMTDLRPHVDKASVLNLCSGSSTILIEHALRYPQDALIAMDNNREILDAGRRNASAAGQLQRIDHIFGRCEASPLAIAVDRHDLRGLTIRPPHGLS